MSVLLTLWKIYQLPKGTLFGSQTQLLSISHSIKTKHTLSLDTKFIVPDIGGATIAFEYDKTALSIAEKHYIENPSDGSSKEIVDLLKSYAKDPNSILALSDAERSDLSSRQKV